MKKLLFLLFFVFLWHTSGNCLAQSPREGYITTSDGVRLFYNLAIDAPPNKSMDVRAKQRLCFNVTLLPFACVLMVSPHVISTVGRFRLKSNGWEFGKIKLWLKLALQSL